MSKTTNELIAKALSKLGVLAAGQTPSAEDQQAVRDVVTPVFEELSNEAVYTVADEDEIDDAVFLPLATIVAERAAPEFGRAGVEQEVMLAKSQIRKITYGRPSGEVLAVDYF